MKKKKDNLKSEISINEHIYMILTESKFNKLQSIIYYNKGKVFSFVATNSSTSQKHAKD